MSLSRLELRAFADVADEIARMRAKAAKKRR